MDDPAWIVPGLTGGYNTSLTALDAKFNDTLDNGTVTVPRMCVTAAGAPRGDRDGKHGDLPALGALYGTVKHCLANEPRHLSRRTDNEQDAAQRGDPIRNRAQPEEPSALHWTPPCV